MRLCAYDCKLSEGSIAHRAYGSRKISERHRHRYEFNNEYRAQLEEAGLQFTGTIPKTGLIEIVEVKDHPYFIGVQFHPESILTPLGSKLLARFLSAAGEAVALDAVGGGLR